MTYSLPNEIIECLTILKNAGIDAYLVGGCVRDMIMGLTPDDYDITTNASPEKIKSLFPHTVDTGIEHGTVTVIINHTPIEITRMRIDGDYLDHRRPIDIIPARSLNEDLLRRDFTINALALDLQGNLTDITRGVHDIKHKTIRAVGNPYKRFSEDALRIMRAYRFCSKLQFNLEKSTQNAAKELAHLLSDISAERIYDELKKTLMGKNPAVVEELILSGGLIKAGLTNCNNLSALNELEVDINIRLSALIILCNADAVCVTNSLKTPNIIKNTVKKIVSIYSDYSSFTAISPKQIKLMIKQSDRSIALMLLKLLSVLKGIDYSELVEKFDSVKNDPIFINELDISGNDLISIGINGTDIGKTQIFLQDYVINNPKDNKKTILLSIAKNIEL